MGRITILSPELINHIAAGEVVERPASVVKELVENAIDAGATQIEILARDGGRNLRVADNGCGMDRADLEIAFRNHATSKVRELDDLFHIDTLGFRGEALASIAAISRITCISRTANASVGLKAVVQSSGEVALQETGCAVGTIFEIGELFYNVPARLKFLKRPQTELSCIQETVQILALSHPEIRFQLKIEDSMALKTLGGGNLAETIHELFSLGRDETLLPFDMSDADSGYRVQGYTSSATVTRGSRKWIILFVNGRGVRCPILSKAVEGAYQSLIPPGKFPMTVLFLNIPPEELDVNVHPTKREVKYQRANTLYSFVRRAIEQALLATRHSIHGETREEFRSPHAFASSSDTTRRNSSFQSYPLQKQRQNFTPLPDISHAAGLGPVPHKPPSFNKLSLEPRAAYSQAAMEFYAAKPHPDEAELSSEESHLPQLPDFKIIGQLSQTYILVENAEGLLLVDQHIASERTRFEFFMERAERSDPAESQRLLLPITLPVSPTLASVLEENRTAFEALGFQCDISRQSVCFTSIPPLYNEKIFQLSLEKLIAHFEETGEIKLSLEHVIATMACHSAVRAGDPLNREQMERIIRQWMQCERPWTCPHGRPVSHRITHREIMGFFDRPNLPSVK